jgi:hypothetical protein
VKKLIKLGLLGLVGAGALAYALDSARVAFSGSQKMYDDVKVDQVYTDTNKWNQVEYSIGNTITERCVNSAFPHGGYRPCWYVKNHTMTVNKTD